MTSIQNNKRNAPRNSTPFVGKARNNNPKKKKIFISWSGDYTKEFAEKLKTVLEENSFIGHNLDCFVSSRDINSGSNWREILQVELQSCEMGIVCITKANIRAPWLYIEAGAMLSRKIPFVPLLLDCDQNTLLNNPLSDNQAIEFNSANDLKRLLHDIKKHLKLKCSDELINTHYKYLYATLMEDLHSSFAKLKASSVITEKDIYPDEVSAYNYNTVFVSVPMASIGSSEYSLLRQSMAKIKDALLTIGFKEVVCQILDIETQNQFDGKNKAIRKSFRQIKQAEYMVVIYPWKIPSSVLIEIGYGIALCKKMVVFHREELPFVLKGATGVIPHVRTYEFNDFDDIRRTIVDNEMELFK